MGMSTPRSVSIACQGGTEAGETVMAESVYSAARSMYDYGQRMWRLFVRRSSDSTGRVVHRALVEVNRSPGARVLITPSTVFVVVYDD